ncbi:hypothetical protein CEXT_698541 [Caerostris extrusa]|uniref:Uncharacterized protein n=1 Tax=Caerostris extrusa TaxID=172846 RepID=A0AAV4Q108_CAEEX|nr:hypothetical protein CEXT_698541 [Caerostris extrusa]
MHIYFTSLCLADESHIRPFVHWSDGFFNPLSTLVHYVNLPGWNCKKERRKKNISIQPIFYIHSSTSTNRSRRHAQLQQKKWVLNLLECWTRLEQFANGNAISGH